ncbi:MAG: hypothetical protein JWP58_4666 [Hymenobacter sp.]|jgi:hypothetical protein|nr:hypothetical protein [Hymenobacter sp.]
MMWLDTWRIAWTAIFSLILLQGALAAKEHQELTSHGLPKPSYHYGAEIPVTCLNRSM